MPLVASIVVAHFVAASGGQRVACGKQQAWQHVLEE